MNLVWPPIAESPRPNQQHRMSSPIENVFNSLSLIAGSEAVMAAAQAWISKQKASPASAASAPAVSLPAAQDKPLEKMNGQELRDTYHALIGKPAGLKNSGKMKNKELLVAEIQRLRSAAAPGAVAEAPAAAAAAPAPVAEVKPKRKAAPATLAWQQFVKHCKIKWPARFLDAEVNPMRLAESMGVVKAIRAEMPDYYATFVADFIEDYKYQTTMAEATVEEAEAEAETKPE